MDTAMLCLIVVKWPYTKDRQHTNRRGKVLPDMTFTSDKKCVKSQDDFLDNQNNKARFIGGLSNHLSQNGFQCIEDADTTIAIVESITHEESMLLSMLMILMF